jgi:hypothetical protein
VPLSNVPICLHSRSVASQSLPTFSHTTTYLPVISRGVAPFILRLKVPISRAAEDPKGLTVDRTRAFAKARYGGTSSVAAG